MTQYILRPLEEKIILMRLQGKSSEWIAEATGYTPGGVRNLTRAFEQKGLIEKLGNCSYRLKGSYHVGKPTKPERRQLQKIGELSSGIPAEIENRIRHLYPIASRWTIAKELGISKFQLNMMILRLRLEGCG